MDSASISSASSTMRKKQKSIAPNGLSPLDSHHGHHSSSSATLNHRHSLAFELAAAMEPDQSDQASILDKLGLGDDELDEDEDDQIYEEDDDDFVDGEEEGDDLQGGDATELVLDDHPRQQDLSKIGGSVRLRGQEIGQAIETGGDNYYYQADDDRGLLDSNNHKDLSDKPRARSRLNSNLNSSPNWQDGDLSLGSPSPRKVSRRSDYQSPPICGGSPAKKLVKQSRSTLNIGSRRSPMSSPFVGGGQAGGEDDYESNSIAPEEDDDYEVDGESDGTEGSEAEKLRLGEALEAGIASTAKFLTALKQSNNDTIMAIRGSSAGGAAPPGHGPGDKDASDRQPVVERLITDLVRTMTDQVRDREAQTRELKEIEIALARTDRRILAELDELPTIITKDEETPEPLTNSDRQMEMVYGSLEDLNLRKEIKSDEGAELGLEHDGVEEVDELDNDEEEEDELDESGRATPTARSIKSFLSSTQPINQLNRSGIPMTKTGGGEPTTNHRNTNLSRSSSSIALKDLDQLRKVTKGLIDSLNIINEHTQINRQTQTDVVRKLKGVRGLVSNWKNENESIESSKSFINQWEDLYDLRGNQNEKSNKRIKGLFEVEVNLAVKETEKLLEEAFIRASKLLEQP